MRPTDRRAAALLTTSLCATAFAQTGEPAPTLEHCATIGAGLTFLQF